MSLSFYDAWEEAERQEVAQRFYKDWDEAEGSQASKKDVDSDLMWLEQLEWEDGQKMNEDYDPFSEKPMKEKKLTVEVFHNSLVEECSTDPMELKEELPSHPGEPVEDALNHALIEAIEERKRMLKANSIEATCAEPPRPWRKTRLPAPVAKTAPVPPPKARPVPPPVCASKGVPCPPPPAATAPSSSSKAPPMLLPTSKAPSMASAQHGTVHRVTGKASKTDDCFYYVSRHSCV